LLRQGVNHQPPRLAFGRQKRSPNSRRFACGKCAKLGEAYHGCALRLRLTVGHQERPEAWWFGVWFEVEGQPAVKPEERTNALLHLISADYFRVMSISLVRGRSFSTSDTAAASGVVIVNQAFVKRFYTNADPVGAHIRMFKTDERTPEVREIVGVVGNVKEHLTDSDNVLQVYTPFAQSPTEAATLVLRTNFDPVLLAPAVRGTIWAVDKNQRLEASRQ
jgi:hypothetical protein